jgi:hypothetical protein
VNDAPRVSVIIPVRNRAGMLRETLEALRSQTFGDFEVIVADDGSTDGSADVAASFGHRVVGTEGVGAVAARTAAVATAAGQILAFTDSDCVPSAEWLATGVAAIDKGADVVQGVTVAARTLEPLERAISHGGHERLFATCNVFYRRDAFDRAGGFDGAAAQRWRFRGPASGRALGFGEDTLLGWTVARQGIVTVAPEAVVRHAVIRPPVTELLWRTWMAGGFPALVREIPELRGTLLRHGFLLGKRRIPLYVVVGAALTGRREIVFAAGLWWLASRGRDMSRKPGPLHRRVLAIPVEMAIDAITAAALLWGSVRSRSIVL